MGLVVISSRGALDIYAALDHLQLEQFEHDEKYHREIARLSVQDRLKHMALHFAKYAGNLVEAAGDEDGIQRIAVDVFIIATSCANILNVRLGELLHAAEEKRAMGLPEFSSALTLGAGRMAAACEKLDHLEDFPFRPTIRDAVRELAAAAIAFSESRQWNLESLVRRRLQGIKEKSIFYGRM